MLIVRFQHDTPRKQNAEAAGHDILIVGIVFVLLGWLPWLADGLNLLFTIAALIWSFAMIIAPHRIDPPLIMFSALPLALFTFKLVKLAHLYAARVGANIRQTLAAALAGLALSHTIGVAVIKALFTRLEDKLF